MTYYYNKKDFLKYKKFGNDWQKLDGYNFASKREAARYKELKLLEKGNLIKDLELQKPFCLQLPFTSRDPIWGMQRGLRYIADFFYYEKDNKKYIIEDVKGFRTPVYLVKRKLLLGLLEKEEYANYRFREL